MKVLVVRGCLLGALLAACACGGNATPAAPPELASIPITDVNPASDVVEVNLLARPGETRFLAGKPAQIWGYADGAVAEPRALVPGPLIEARQGDTVIVHFTNMLPEATTIHWHGIRVPNGSDGTHATQHLIQPGETFDYQFVAVDAGTFWYHPHHHSDVQIERGLAGALVVSGGVDVPVD